MNLTPNIKPVDVGHKVSKATLQWVKRVCCFRGRADLTYRTHLYTVSDSSVMKSLNVFEYFNLEALTKEHFEEPSLSITEKKFSLKLGHGI